MHLSVLQAGAVKGFKVSCMSGLTKVLTLKVQWGGGGRQEGHVFLM